LAFYFLFFKSQIYFPALRFELCVLRFFSLLRFALYALRFFIVFPYESYAFGTTGNIFLILIFYSRSF